MHVSQIQFTSWARRGQDNLGSRQAEWSLGSSSGRSTFYVVAHVAKINMLWLIVTPHHFWAFTSRFASHLSVIVLMWLLWEYIGRTIATVFPHQWMTCFLYTELNLWWKACPVTSSFLGLDLDTSLFSSFLAYLFIDYPTIYSSFSNLF